MENQKIKNVNFNLNKVLVEENENYLNIKEKLFYYLDNISEEEKILFKNELEKVNKIKETNGVDVNIEFTEKIYEITEITLDVNMQEVYGSDIYSDYGGGMPIAFLDLDLSNIPNFLGDAKLEDLDEDELEDLESEKNSYKRSKLEFIAIFTILEMYFN